MGHILSSKGLDFSVLILLDCNIHLGNFLKIPISGHNLNPSELESPGKRLGHLPGSQGDSWGQPRGFLGAGKNEKHWDHIPSARLCPQPPTHILSESGA